MRNRGKGRGSRGNRPDSRGRAHARVHHGPGGQKPVSSTGELHVHRDGYGFVSQGGGAQDVFIPARFIGDALHGDVVEVEVGPGRGGKLEGRIIGIAERRTKHLMGRFERYGDAYQVVADDRRVRHRIMVPTEHRGAAKHGDNVVVRILRHPKGQAPMQGAVVQILGARGEDATEKAAIIARHQLVREFPQAVLDEAERVAKSPGEGVLSGRRDLSGIPFVTIDGETAKDFDDAVAVERRDGGIIRLWVSIADVSHFVRPQTPLDKEAYERGTSVYFPGDCLPMLPERLSNDLCSLKANEARLTLTAEMDVDPGGHVARSDFYRSAIKSRERMTYTAIKQILVGRDAQARGRYNHLLSNFELMEECFGRLRKMRLARGSIDFDLPEPEIITDIQGEISDIVRAERHVGHMMIEEFMVLANESVAEFLTSKRAGCIYRVHEPPPPEKLKEFSALLNNLGHRFHAGKDVPPGALARIVNAVKGRPEERLVNHSLLRSMSQAAYSPENKGHYGLASRCYCHFTSPIRRYPDLIVHRLLTNALAAKGGRGDGGGAKIRGLAEIAEHSSRRERVAMAAEREIAKLMAAQFMKSRMGEEFDGIISHMGKFGFFVELIEFFVEGLVSIEYLPDDRFRFEEAGMVIRGQKKKRTFRIGDKVRVEVAEVDIPNREIVFDLVNHQ